MLPIVDLPLFLRLVQALLAEPGQESGAAISFLMPRSQSFGHI
jgi:hypothetical protein